MGVRPQSHGKYSARFLRDRFIDIPDDLLSQKRNPDNVPAPQQPPPAFPNVLSIVASPSGGICCLDPRTSKLLGNFRSMNPEPRNAGKGTVDIPVLFDPWDFSHVFYGYCIGQSPQFNIVIEEVPN
jgi:hypothetical protein